MGRQRDGGDMVKLLIAEDDTLQLSLYRSWMSDLFSEYPGIVVTILSDGRDISSNLKSSIYDITILDVALPKKSGLDLYRENGSSMGVIILSSSYGDVFKSYLNAESKCIILNKPLTKERFDKAIQEAMEEIGHAKQGTAGSSQKLSTIE